MKIQQHNKGTIKHFPSLTLFNIKIATIRNKVAALNNDVNYFTVLDFKRVILTLIILILDIFTSALIKHFRLILWELASLNLEFWVVKFKILNKLD